MHQERTNSPSTSIPISEILWNQFTNYSEYGIELKEELVRQLRTIYFSTNEGRKVIDYIIKNPAFTVTVLRHETGVNKRTAYDCIEKIPWLVKKTKHKVRHPNPRTRGPYPHIYTVIGANEEDIKKARSYYWTIQEKYDPAFQHLKKLKEISASIAHQLIEKGIRYGDPDEILEITKTIPATQLHQSDRPIVVKQVFEILRENRGPH